ncbi:MULTISPECIES: protease inhibitor I42 family protein [unclassified Streptomyces]|uniref:protease inhibitor I42 family protein n=1 Tax=unclassified Streptomyces TaxID=2593676 RepID=UPI0011A27CC8|nr:protease inhibitor I42 family protein [Streptomyces sp. BK340]TVZ97868.1 putative secreted protein [Streptomyces sp. BK340]
MRTVMTSLATAAAAVLVLSGCGGQGGVDEYGTKERGAVTVGAGDEFTLKVPANPALGQNWYLAEPRPDKDILKYRGKREEESGGGSTGSGDGTQYFDFTALKSGKATVKLLHCPMAGCHSGTESAAPFPNATAPGTTTMSPFPTATGTPDDLPAFFVYTITVR